MNHFERRDLKTKGLWTLLSSGVENWANNPQPVVQIFRITKSTNSILFQFVKFNQKTISIFSLKLNEQMKNYFDEPLI